MKLLSVSSDPKTVKGEAHGFLTGVQYMLPSKTLCPNASPGCFHACLQFAGRGQMSTTRTARKARVDLFFNQPDVYWLMLKQEVAALQRKADRQDMVAAVRMNGLSDIPWEAFEEFRALVKDFPRVRFYDYTKRTDRVPLPGYDLTFSRSETNDAQALAYLEQGRRVSVVFAVRKGEPLPKTWKGFPVTDGDLHDLTFVHPMGVVGLRAKGKARHDTSGFVCKGVNS